MHVTLFRNFCRAALATFALAAPAVSRAQAGYTITNLGALSGGASYGQALNASRQAAGYSYTAGNAARHAVRYSGAALDDLGTLGGTNSYGYGINSSGQVAGQSDTTTARVSHAALWTGTTALDLGVLGGSTSMGYAVNDSGQVTGYSSLAGSTGYHAFRYSGGALADLGTLGGTNSYGYGINSSGQIAGYAQTANNAAFHAVRWTGTTATDLGASFGALSVGLAINDSGQVAGYAQIGSSSAYHAIRWTGTTSLDLGVLGAANSYGRGINAAGDVVGNTTSTGGAQVAFLYTNGRMIDLNTLLPTGSGWQLNIAYAINGRGEITGQGTFNGQTRAFLLQPGTVTVGGYVEFEGVHSLYTISSAAPAGMCRISFRTPGTTTEIFGANVALVTGSHVVGGVFYVSGAPAGTFDIAIKGAKNLQVVLPNQVTTGGATLPDVVLPAGDANNDNSVDSSDFGVLIGAFNTDSSVVGGGYDPTADFNFDGVVDSSDFGLLIGEFNNAGAP